MAIFKSGINGGFSGKAGTVVGYYSMGKWIMRGLPELSEKAKRGTPKQKKSRSLFSKMQRFLSSALPFIRVGFNMEGRSRQITAHNAAISHNMLNAFTAEEIDYSKVLFSFGQLPGALNPSVQTDNTALQFTWDNNSGEGEARPSDQVMLLAFDVTAFDKNIKNKDANKKRESYYMLSGARRKTGAEMLELPSVAKGHTFHTYIGFISDDRESVSISNYLGEITF
jgi:hypothetical protein